MLNNVCLVGRLVADPQITPLKEGTVTSFTLAIREGEEKFPSLTARLSIMQHSKDIATKAIKSLYQAL